MCHPLNHPTYRWPMQWPLVWRGGRIRTGDLKVMGLAGYHCPTPRYYGLIDFPLHIVGRISEKSNAVISAHIGYKMTIIPPIAFQREGHTNGSATPKFVFYDTLYFLCHFGEITFPAKMPWCFHAALRSLGVSRLVLSNRFLIFR